MKIPEILLASLIRQYQISLEDAQAKIPTRLSLAIEAIWREFDSNAAAYADRGIREDARDRTEGKGYDADPAHAARLAGAL